jgi:hypothetical protein
MTQISNTINLVDQLADLAALHCILLPKRWTDRERALEAAADCFYFANWCPSEAEVGEQFLALAAALHDAKQSQTAPASPPRAHRLRKPHHPPPDGLKTAAQAASKLGCSVKTLDGYIKAGALKYVAIGHGRRRQRRMFSEADLNEFVAAQTRKDSPCPSAATRAPRSGSTISKSEIVAFSEVRKRRRDAKPRK